MSTPRKNKNNLYALVIAHTDGTIYVRTVAAQFGAVAAALCRSDVEFTVDLTSDASDGPLCLGVRAWVHDEYEDGDAHRVAQHLREYGMLTFAYEAFYESVADGPLVRYRHADPAAVPDRSVRLAFNIDYGAGDGSWYFGTPDMIAMVARVARERGIRTYLVGGERDGQGQAVAVDSDAMARRGLKAELDLRGIWLHEDNFGPVDAAGEDTRNSTDDT